VLLPYVVVPIYAVVNPPLTPLMVQNVIVERAGIDKDWVGLDAISPRLVRAVLASEDARFCSHHGIDWVEVRNAMQDDDGPMRGASTITMQVARNLFFPDVRSWVRKGFEVPLALYVDLVLSKRRILEIYLNVAQFGIGLYGAEAAAERYFGTSAAKLTPTQAALIAVTLPAPATRDPAKPSRAMSRRARVAASRANQLGANGDCVLG
jgi:monofunctional biosynthetic peptidoglycan transglycosylase